MSSQTREPPAGGIWDVPLEEARFAFVDLEMTGLDAARHRVVEICVAHVEGGEETGRLESFVRPDPLPESVGNSHVHGIKRDRLVSAPTFAELADRVAAMFEGAILVAHGAKWDMAFLAAEMGRLDRAFVIEHHIDTVALSRRVLTADNHKLATLATQLGIKNDNPHRAGSDVAVTRELFQHLVGQIADAERGTVTPRTLWRWCAGKRPVRPEILEAATCAKERAQVVVVRYKPARRGEQQLEFVVTDVRRDLDPPIVLGYLHITRGRRELRADRILSIEPSAK